MDPKQRARARARKKHVAPSARRHPRTAARVLWLPELGVYLVDVEYPQIHGTNAIEFASAFCEHTARCAALALERLSGLRVEVRPAHSPGQRTTGGRPQASA